MLLSDGDGLIENKTLNEKYKQFTDVINPLFHRKVSKLKQFFFVLIYEQHCKLTGSFMTQH